MDKKRREKLPFSKASYIDLHIKSIHAVLKPTEKQMLCGIVHKKGTFLKEYGCGFFESFYIKGISIHLLHASALKTIKLKRQYPTTCFELSYLLDGEQLIELNNLKPPLIYESLDSYFINLKETTGAITYLKNKFYREIRIQMHHSFIEKYNIKNEAFKTKNTQGLNASIFKPHCKYTQHILTELFNDKQKGFFKRLFLESKVLDLIRLHLKTHTPQKTEFKLSTANYVKKLYKVQAIISSNLSKQYTINELARAVGLNDFILKKEFKVLFGKTIFQYISHLRMKKAKKLLKHTSKPIYEIAELIGYKNATHFSAAFKRTFKISPKAYRLLKKSYQAE